MLAAVDGHLAGQDRPHAPHAHVGHRQLLCLRGILDHDHVVAGLRDPEGQVQFRLWRAEQTGGR